MWIQVVIIKCSGLGFRYLIIHVITLCSWLMMVIIIIGSNSMFETLFTLSQSKNLGTIQSSFIVQRFFRYTKEVLWYHIYVGSCYGLDHIDDELRRYKIRRMIDDHQHDIGGDYLYLSKIRDQILVLRWSFCRIFARIRSQIPQTAPLFHFGNKIRCTLIRNLE